MPCRKVEDQDSSLGASIYFNRGTERKVISSCIISICIILIMTKISIEYKYHTVSWKLRIRNAKFIYT
jgi:hypothetical protein